MKINKIIVAMLSLFLVSLWIHSILSKNDVEQVWTITEADCQKTVNGMYELISNLDIPENLMSLDYGKAIRWQGDEFDVNEYFNILTSIRMKPGYTLDYVYLAMLGNGSPILYARPINAKRYTTFLEYQQAILKSGDEQGFFWSRLGDMMHDNTPADFDMKEEDYQRLKQQPFDYIVSDNSQHAYFQWVLLHVLGEQFYLKWHANYDDDVVACSNEHLQQVFEKYNDWSMARNSFNEIADDLALATKDVSFEPEVVRKNGSAEVTLIVFSKWGGLDRVTYEIHLNGRHTFITEKKREKLYEYQTGIRF